MSNRLLRRSLYPLALCAALSAAGCVSNSSKDAGAESADSRPAYLPYVTQPERLKPSQVAPDALVWEDSSVDMKKYRSVGLERIRVALENGTGDTAVDPADLAMLTRYFQESIGKALGKEYPLVDRTGPDVMRIKVTIYDLKPTNVAATVTTLVIPFATVPDLASGAVTEGGVGASPYLGRTGIAVQFLDGASGKVIGEYVETRFGKKYVVDTSGGAGGAVSTGFSNYGKAFSSWDYAKQAFDAWSQQLRNRLDRAHGRSVKS